MTAAFGNRMRWTQPPAVSSSAKQRRTCWHRPLVESTHKPQRAEPMPAPRVWYAFALHGGNPCSIHIGHWPTTFRLAMEYCREQGGGEIHFVEERR